MIPSTPNKSRRVTTSRPFLTTKELALTALMTAVTCILGPLSIPLPFSPVPVTFTNLAIYFSIYVLGMRKGTISYIVYFLLGLVGLPVFSGFAGGPGKITGPTGGYLIGFFFLSLISGCFIDRWHAKKVMAAAGLVLGSAVCYLFGTLWLSRQLSISFAAGLGTGVLPYLPGDIIKIIIAVIAGPKLRKAVNHF